LGRKSLDECVAEGLPVLFDTSVLIDAWRSSLKMGLLWPAIARRWGEKGRRHMSTISMHELLAGDEQTGVRLEERKRQLEWARERFNLVEVSRTADHALRAFLDNLPPPPRRSIPDRLIAATAISGQFALATFDLDDFSPLEVMGLTLVVGLPRDE
jgi:predicted nucleic acid-binding protein